MIENYLCDTKLTTTTLLREGYPTAELIKYSPGRRCLFLIRRDNTDFFVKLYPKKFLRNDRGQKMHQVSRAIWEMTERGELTFRVPRPVMWDPETITLWQERLAGKPAVFYFNRSGQEALSILIGRLIADISASKVPPHRVFDRNEQLKDSLEHRNRIAAKFPVLAFKANALIESLSEVHETVPVRRMVPTHGDMHLDQLLFDGDKLGVLDWEDFALAEPERELAFFAVQTELEFGDHHGWRKIVSGMLSGYRSGGHCIHRKAYCLYKAHKYFSKAAKCNDESEARKLFDKTERELEKCYGKKGGF
jgi:hypothetical protein